jgi:hypothetical protein
MKRHEFTNFVEIGDASEKLKELYSKGWHLVTVSTPYAVAISESKILKNENKEDKFYLYAIEYFLEREI